MAKKKLPLYELRINLEEDAIVSAISLVEQPAIEANFLAFNTDFKIEQFSSDDEKHELLGAAMIPDQRIFRFDKATGEEYEVFFSAETIRQIAQQYFKMGFQKSMNLNHSMVPAKSYIFQSYIVDESKGLPAPKGVNVPNGSWVIGVKVEDKETWADIKSGKVKGFSIEGTFQFIESRFSKQEDADEQVLKLINQMNSIINKLK